MYLTQMVYRHKSYRPIMTPLLVATPAFMLLFYGRPQVFIGPSSGMIPKLMSKNVRFVYKLNQSTQLQRVCYNHFLSQVVRGM